MPCYDAGPSREQMQADDLNRRIAEAMLCALLRTEPGRNAASLLVQEDFTKAGVSKDQFHDWRVRHLREDQAREKREAEQAAAAKRRTDALAKLTPEELAELGLK